MTTQSLNPILQTAIADVISRLNAFAQDPLFTEKMSFVFGKNVSVTPRRFLNLLQGLPKIEVLGNELQGALGAFSAQTNTIYLSANLLTSGQSEQLKTVVMEEVGHYLDSRLNVVDTKGDEGELFSAVVSGINLSPTELTRIQNENDQKQIILDGKLLIVEQAENPYFYTSEGRVTIIHKTLNQNSYVNIPMLSVSQISGDNVITTGLFPWDGGRLNYLSDLYLFNFSTFNFSTFNFSTFNTSSVPYYKISGLFENPYDPFWGGSTGPKDFNPSMSGNNIVWYCQDHTHTKLFFWNKETDLSLELENSVLNTDILPQISGDHVVWVANHGGSNEIYLWDGTTTTQITQNTTDDKTPKVSGNNIAWLGFDGNDYEVYLWNGSTTTQITDNSTDETNLGMSETGNNLVWQGFDGKDYEIYTWNGSSTIQLTNNSVDDVNPKISSKNVIWSNNEGFYFWNGYNAIQLDRFTFGAEISGSNVVWTGSGDTYKAWFWNGIETHLLMSSENFNVFIEPQISGNNVGWNSVSNGFYVITSVNGGFTATSEFDSIAGNEGNDAVFTTFFDIQQNDIIDGGIDTDTLTISEGTSVDQMTINASNTANQVPSITGTVISNFERFDLSNFVGTLNFTGSNGNDWVKAGKGNDNLDGGLGADQLWGGLGNDTYIVDNIRDVVTENPNEGKDLVQSTVNTTLTNNVEDLTLLGTANINGTGNNANNILTGNSGANLLKGLNGNDTLSGGAGNDTLIGGLGNDRLVGEAGADQFLFGSSSAFKTSNLGVDTITDFTKNSDKIALSKVTFNALISPIGTLQTAEFVQINSLSNELSLVGSSSEKVVYNQATGNLFYNPDGAIAGLTNGGQFSTLSNKPSLSATDFLVQS